MFTAQDEIEQRAREEQDERDQEAREDAERERYEARGTYVVAIYEEDRCFGGREEGGWWYDAGTLKRVVAVVKGRERAWKVANRINGLLRFRRRLYGRDHYGYSIDSVCYAGGHLAAHVYERTAPESFPESRPFYE